MSNWQPLLLQLVQADAKVDAVKLSAKVRAIDLEHALHEMDDVFSYRRLFPDSNDHPDRPDHVLAFFRRRLDSLSGRG